MTSAERKLVRDAARAIAAASIRGTALELVTLPDGGTALCIMWGHNPEPADILRNLTPALTAEVARTVLRTQARVAATGDPAA